MMRPKPWVRMPGSTVWHAATADSRLTASMAWKSLCSCFANGFEIAAPALLTRISQCPNETMASRSAAGSVTSAVAYRAPSVPAACCSATASRPISAIAAPSAQRRRAMASPMPLAPPVITALRPCSGCEGELFISHPNNLYRRDGSAARSVPCRPGIAAATTARCSPKRQRRAARSEVPTDAAGQAHTDRRARPR